MLTGENGILKMAGKAKEETEIAGEKEQIQLAMISFKMDNLEVNEINIKNKLEQYFQNVELKPISTYEQDGWYYKGKDTYFIGKDGSVISTIDRSSIKIGDYINYQPDLTQNSYSLAGNISGTGEEQLIVRDTSLKWRVLSTHSDGSIDLISDTMTTDIVKLKGARGYCNGVYILNDICEKLYSNLELNVKASSINMEHIEKLMSEKGIAYKNNYKYITANDSDFGSTGTEIKFGNVYTSFTNRNYPVLYANEIGSGISSDKVTVKNGINQSDAFYSSLEELVTSASNEKSIASNKGLTVTQTYYGISANESGPDKFKSKLLYDLIFANGTKYENSKTQYWISTRMASVNSEFNAVYWGLFSVYNTTLGIRNLYNSYPSSQNGENPLRIICKLPKDININTENKTGAVDSMYTIK